MTKKPSLMATAAKAAGKARSDATAAKRDGGKPSAAADDVTLKTTAISIPKWALDLMADIANERAKRDGGRRSVSGVILSLIEKNRADLEREMKS